MTYILDVPEARQIPAARRDADIAMLTAVVSGSRAQARRHKHRWIFAAASVTALAACGTASAALFLPARPATVRNMARCYTVASADTGTGFPGSTIAVDSAGPGGHRPASARSPAADVPAQALSVCAMLWRQGFLRPGAATAVQPTPGVRHRVPPLVACTLPSGEAAVFPGPPHTCARLGLPPMTR